MTKRSWLVVLFRALSASTLKRRVPRSRLTCSAIESLESRALLSPVALGPETQVNTYTIGTQSKPFVAMDSNGDYVAVWQSFGQDGDRWGVYGQLFTSAGTPKGSEFRVNTTTAHDQLFAAVAMDSAGDFVVTWQGRTSNGDYDVYAQRYNSAGVAQGGEFTVNTYTTDWQTRPAVAMDQNGDFAITWLSYSQYADHNFSTYFQRFNAAGVAQGVETRIGNAGNSTPSIGMASNGSFAITFDATRAERFNAAGTDLGTVSLSMVPSGFLAMDPAGDFVVASNSGTQRFNAAGVAQGSVIAAGGQFARAAMTSSGGFVVSWDTLGSSDREILAQQFNSAGVAQGSSFQVNTYTASTQSQSAVAMDSSGNFVVVWHSDSNQDGSDFGVFSQRYSATGGPLIYGIESTPLNVLAAASTPITHTLVFNKGIPTLASATVKITGNYVNGQDQLGFVNTAKITGSWNAATATLTLTGTDNFTNYMAALRSVTYHNTSASPNTALTRTISFQANDGTTLGNTISRDVKVLSSAAAPALSGTTASINYVENAAATALSPNLVITDANNLTIFSATVSFTNWQGEDRVAFTNTYGLQHSLVQDLNAHTATLTISGADTEAHYQALLRSVVYSDVSNNPVTTTRVATFSVNNGVSNSNKPTENITVTSVNDAPIISGIETTTRQYNGLGPASPVTATLALSDADDANLVGATVQISNYQNGQDVLTFANTAKITGTFDGFTGKLTLTGTDTISNYRTALRSVMFANTSAQPTAGTRTISFQVNDGHAANHLSNVGTRTISVLPPMLSGVPSTALSFTENGAPLALASSIVVQPANSQNITTATIKITGNYVMGQDRLAFSNTGGVTGSFDAATGTLTLTGTKPYATYQTMLRSVTYQNVSDNPSTAARTITISAVDDVGDASNIITRQLNVTAVNDAPVLSAIEGTTLTYAHGSAATAVTSSILLTDADDANLAGATIKITAGFQSGADVLQFVNTAKITGSYNASTGVLTLTGTDTVSNYRTALRSVKFANMSASPTLGMRTISFQANDGHASNNLSNTVSRNVNVT